MSNNSYGKVISSVQNNNQNIKTMNKRVHTIMCLQYTYKTSFKIYQKHQFNKVNYGSHNTG